MTQQDMIADIERRASALGLTIKELCEAANVHPTSFSRWKQTQGNPRPVGANMKLTDRLVSELEKREKTALAA